MAIYELEDRIYFDGGLPADIAEVDNTSEQEIEDTDTVENNNNPENTDNSENVSIAPESPSSEEPGDNDSDKSSDDSSDSADSNSQTDGLTDSLTDGLTDSQPDSIAAVLDAIDDTTITDDLLANHNFLIISADNENLDEITDSLNDNTTLIIYDSDDTFDSIIQQLKDELGDNKAVNIGIVDSEKIIDNSEKCNDFLGDLKDLQYFDGEINVIDLRLETTDQRLENGEPVRSSLGESGSIEARLSILSTDSNGEWSINEDTDSDDLTDYFDSDSAFLSTESLESNVQSPESINEIYFIDSNIDNIDQILAEIPEDAVVIELAEGEGMDKITDIINDYTDIDAVHIISQANYAQILLGKDVITADNIDDYSEAFSSWSDNLSTDADILFYGCDIAKEVQGQSVINQIAEWTGADITASTDITGGFTTESTENTEGFSISLSSNIQNSTSNIIPDWDLEYSTGSIEATVLTVTSYNHHLLTYTVTEITDNGTGAVNTLSWAINQSNATTDVDDDIVFNLSSGDTVTISAELPTITDTVDIDGANMNTGNNVTVTVADQSSSDYRVFDINLPEITVTLQNMTIKGGTIAANGGGISLTSGTLNMDNCTVSGSTAANGGGIFINAGLSASITNSEISGNTANGDGGGGIFNAGTITSITTSTISSNNASTGSGGGIFNSSTGTIDSIEKTTISGNTADSGRGGGIENHQGTITLINNSTISGNSASVGGGISNYNNDTANAVITKISNSTISGNTADTGGGIYNGGLPGATSDINSIVNSTISGNTANGAGGGIYNYSGAVTLDSCTIANNHSDHNNDGDGDGGGIYQLSGTLTVGNTIIANNYKGSSSPIGDDYYYADGTLDDNGYNVVEYQNRSDFNNSTDIIYIDGWYFGNNGSYLDKQNFSLDTTLTYTGGFTKTLAITGASGDSFLTNADGIGSTSSETDQRGYYRTSSLISRGAYQYYGVFAKQGGTSWTSGTDTYSEWINAIAAGSQNGETVILADTAIYAEDVVFDLDELPGSNPIIIQGSGTDSTYVQPAQTAGTAADRVFNIDDGTTVTLENMTIRYGKITGQFGGGIINSGTLTINNSTISDNSTDLNGGGISNSVTGTLTINNSTISGNTSDAKGGGIYNKSNLYIYDSTISSNTTNGGGGTKGGGGGIFNSNGTLKIYDSTISGNEVQTNNNAGGGIVNYGYGTLGIYNSTVAGNKALNEGGGGIWNYKSDATISNCTISGNATQGTSNGAGIYNYYGSTDTTLTVRNSIISGNINNNNDYDFYNSDGGPVEDGGYNVVEYSNTAANDTGGFNATTDILFNTKNGQAGVSFSSWTQGGSDLVNQTLGLSSNLALNNNTNGTYTLALSEDSFAVEAIPYADAGSGVWNGSSVNAQGNYEDQRGEVTTADTAISIGAYSQPPISIYYMAKSTGDWSSTSIWYTNTTGGTDPDDYQTAATETPIASNSDGIYIGGTYSDETTLNVTVTVNLDVSADQTTVSSGSGLTVADPVTLTVANGNGTDLTADGTITVNATAGKLLIASGAAVDSNAAFSVNGDLSFDDGGANNGTLNLAGTVILASLDAGSGTITYDGGNQTIVSGDSITYNNLSLAGTGTKTASGNITAGGTLTQQGSSIESLVDTNGNNITAGGLTVSGGIFNPMGYSGVWDINGDLSITGDGTLVVATSGNLSVEGNWSNSSEFEHNNGTVIIDGSGTSTITGSNTFYNFTCTTAGKTLEFDSTGLQTIDHLFTVKGSSDSVITIAPSEDSTAAAINVTYSDVDYVNVSYSSNLGNPIYASNSTDGGNNSGWVFSASGDYVWIGEQSSVWTNNENWLNGSAPDQGTENITISIALNPLNITGTRQVNDLTVNSGAELIVSTGSIEVDGTSDFNGTLTINSGTYNADGTFDATTGFVTFDGTGTLQLGSDVTSLGVFTKSTGTVEYNASGAQNVLDYIYYNLSIKGSGTKTLKGDLESANRINNLIIDADDSNTVSFDADGYDINSTTLSISADGSITDSGTAGQTALDISTTSSIGGNITTLGTQNYTGAVSITDNVTFDADNADITFNGSVTGTSADNLTVNAGTATAWFKDTIGTDTDSQIAVLDVTGTTNIKIDGNVTTTGTQDFKSNVLLGGNVTFKATNSNITFDGSVTGTSADNLTVNAGTATAWFKNTIGAGSQIAVLDVTGGINIKINGNVTTTGTQDFNSNVLLGGNVTFQATNSNITFDGTITGSSSVRNLTVTVGTGTATFSGTVGAENLINQITVTADEVSIGNTFKGQGNITLQQSTASTVITLGSGTDGLDLSAAELGYLTAGVDDVVTIGNSSSGAITVGADSTLSNITSLHLKTGAGITATAGGISVTNLAITAGAAVNFTDENTNVTKLAVSNSGNNVTFTESDGFTVDNVDTVNGITCAALTLSSAENTIAVANTSAANDVDASGNLTVTGTLNNSGTIAVAGVTTTLSDTDTIIGGIFKYDGTTQTVAAANYTTLVFEGTGSTKTFADGETKVANVISLTDSITLSGATAEGESSTVQVTIPYNYNGASGTDPCTHSRVFNIDASGETVNIENMTIKGGDISSNGAAAAGYGGGIYVTTGTLNLDSVTVSGSKAYHGGGVYAADGNITINNSTISYNVAEKSGGGIYIYNSGSATITLQNSTIANNDALNNYGSEAGGGIYNKGTLNVWNSTIAQNSTSYGGSGVGICAVAGSVNIRNSIVADNQLNNLLSDFYYTGGTVTDSGYNIVKYQGFATSWTDTSGFDQETDYLYNYNKSGDVISSPTSWNKNDEDITGSLELSDTLAENGGPTRTLAITNSGSIAIGNGYYDAGVTTVDQRNAARHIAGQTIGAYEYYADYRTDSGSDTSWSLASNWEIFNGISWSEDPASAPDAANSSSIEIRRNMNVDTSIEVDQTTIDVGATLTVNDGITLTITDGSDTDLTVNGAMAVEGSGIISCDTDSLVDYALTGNQNIFVTAYYNLLISGGSNSIKSLTGTTTVLNDLTVATDTELAGSDKTLNLTGADGTADINGTVSVSTGSITVTGTSDIDGTLSITSTGAYDANGSFDAANGSISFDSTGSLYLAGNVTSLGSLSNDHGTVFYDGTTQDVAAATYYNLKLSGSGTKTLQGNLEEVNRIHTLTVDASSDTVSFDTDGYDIYATALTLASDGSITDSGNNGTTVLNISDTSSIGGNITTLSTQTYSGAVTLTAASTFKANSGSAASAVTFGNTVNGAFTLNIGSGEEAGNQTNVIFNNTVGNNSPLNSLTVYGTSSIGGNITTSGTQEYTGDVTLTGNVSLTASDCDVSFGSRVLADAGINNRTLTIDSGAGNIEFAGAVGNSNNALNTLTITHAGNVDFDSVSTRSGGLIFTNEASGTVTLNGNISTDRDSETSGSVEIKGAVVLGNDIIINTGSNNTSGSIIISGTVNGTSDNTQSLTLNAGSDGTVSVTGAIGGTENKQLNTLTVTNSNGASFAAVTADTSVVLTDSAVGANITFTGALKTPLLDINENKGFDIDIFGDETQITDAVVFDNTGTLAIGNSSEDSISFVGGFTADETYKPSSITTMGTITSNSAAVSFNTLVVAGDTTVNTTGGTQTYGSVTINNGKTLTAGTGNTGAISFGGTIDSASGDTGSLTINTNNTATLSENIGSDTTLGTVTLTSGTLNASNHNITANNLDINGGTFGVGATSSGLWDIGNVEVADGATLNATSGTFKVSGNWTIDSNGTFSHNDGTVTFDGSATQTVETGGSNFYDVVLVNTFEGINIELSSDTTIDHNLTITDGIIDVNNNTLTVSGSILGETGITDATDFDAEHMILVNGTGKLQLSVSENISYLFPVGTYSETKGYDYSPITVEFTEGSFDTGAYVEVSAAPDKYENNPSETNYLSRYWDAASDGITNFSATVTCYYDVNDDVVGIETNIYGAEYLSENWRELTAVDTDNNSFTIAEVTSLAVFSGIAAPYTANVAITPSTSQTITAGNTIQFSAAAYDQYGNLITDTSTDFTWTNTTDTGLFNSTTADSYTVNAVYDSVSSGNVTVTVEPGAVNTVSISPSTSQTLTSGETVQFSASAYDLYENLITDTATDFTWTNTTNTGLFNSTAAGTYTVNAVYNSVSSVDVSVTVNAPTPIPPINDGTQTQTDTGWRTSIDNGPSDSIDSDEGFEENEVDGVGLILKSLVTFDVSIESVANGEYGVGTGSGALGSGIAYDGEYGINANSGSMVNGEYGVGNSSGIEQEFDSGYDGIVDLTFNFESNTDLINHEAIAAYNERHPLFKTELDNILDKV